MGIWNPQSLSQQQSKHCHPFHPTDFFTNQILCGRMTSCNKGLSSNDNGGRGERPWNEFEGADGLWTGIHQIPYHVLSNSIYFFFLSHKVSAESGTAGALTTVSPLTR